MTAPLIEFDYGAPAEIFMRRAKGMRQTPLHYRRFPTAAEAIRFTVEEWPNRFLAGTVMEVSERRFDHDAIRALYDGPHYPLPRSSRADG